MGPLPMNPTCPRCGGKHGVEVSGDGYEHDCAACGGHLICAIGDEGEMYPWHRAGEGGDDDEGDSSPADLSLSDYLDRMVAGTLTRPGREELAEMVRGMMEVACKVKRGCSCDYDYRCGNCQAVVDLHDAIDTARAKEGK